VKQYQTYNSITGYFQPQWISRLFSQSWLWEFHQEWQYHDCNKKLARCRTNSNKSRAAL